MLMKVWGLICLPSFSSYRFSLNFSLWALQEIRAGLKAKQGPAASPQPGLAACAADRHQHRGLHTQLPLQLSWNCERKS